MRKYILFGIFLSIFIFCHSQINAGITQTIWWYCSSGGSSYGSYKIVAGTKTTFSHSGGITTINVTETDSIASAVNGILKSDGTTLSAATASDLPIDDLGNIITGTEVETALQENRTAIDLNTSKVTNATHTGEVTGATALTITADAVTYDKMQDTTGTDKLLGRSTAAAGTIEEITCTSAGRDLIDDADASAQRTTLGVDAAGTDNSTDVTLNANAITAGLSLVTQELNYRAATNAQTGYMTDALVTNIETNNGKSTNVSTALSVGTVGVDTVAITSDGGADDVTLPAATVTTAGMLTTAKWGEIVANNAKNTNVSTTLSVGTVNATTYGITSDGGIDDIVLPEADTTNAGLLGSDKWDEIVANSLKTTNATHTGEVTGATALTIADSIAVTNWNLTTPTITTKATCPEIENTGNITIDAINAAAASTVSITNSDATYKANLTVEGNASAATYGSDSSVTDAELLYINTLSSNAQTQITANTNKTTESTTVSSPLVLSTYDIAIPAATNAAAGHASAAHITAIEANTTHAADNSQAHSDYLLNSESDTMSGTLTADGLTIGNNENITFGSDTFYFDAVTSNDFEISDDINITDNTPHIRFIDNTANEDDFDICADGNILTFMNYTDTTGVFQINANNEFNSLRNSNFTTMFLTPQADPPAANEGDMYADTDHKLYYYDGTSWDDLTAGAGSGDLKADGTVPLTANWDVGAFNIHALTFTSDQATGTAPFTVASTTEVANLKAATVTNATLTTALTVDTGTVGLTGNAANNSALTIGAGAVSVSGSNTGDNTVATTGDSATAFFDAGTIEHERGGLEADVNAYTGLVKINGGSTSDMKVNWAAAAPPVAATDDITLGYIVGSFWHDTTNDKSYVCLDNTDGAAVWTETTQAGGSAETLATTLAAGADANDVSITSLNKLEGVDAQVYIGLGTNGKIILEADTEVEITSPLEVTGLVTLTSGQIKFPATAVPSADPNTIDDYEEGTWTPILGGSGGTSGQTYSIQYGHYTKVGVQVTCTFFVIFTAKGTITSHLRLMGLPFTIGSINDSAVAFAYPASWTLTAGHSLFLQVQGGTTHCRCYEANFTGDTPSVLTTTNVADNTSLQGMFCYFI